MMRILAIISTHGNELLGPNLLAYMLAKRSKLLENMEFIMANPRAYAKNVRYTEIGATDLAWILMRVGVRRLLRSVFGY